jgi:hypothetical protein
MCCTTEHTNPALALHSTHMVEDALGDASATNQPDPVTWGFVIIQRVAGKVAQQTMTAQTTRRAHQDTQSVPTLWGAALALISVWISPDVGHVAQRRCLL